MSGYRRSPVRVAVAGAGQWGQNLIRNFDRLGALRVICDQRAEALESCSSLYPETVLTSAFDSLLSDPDIDAVALATPAESHFQLARMTIDSGKDVFVEKPLALSVSEGEMLARLAASRGRIAMVGHLLHYHPAIRKIMEMIVQGELGRIYYMSSNRLNLGRVRREENVLWSFAPHDISVMIMLAGGQPISVAAAGGSYLQPSICDTTITCLTFPHQIRGHIYVSWLHPFKDHKLVVIGSQRMLVFDDLENHEKIKLYDKGVEPGSLNLRNNGFDVVPFEAKEPLRVECAHFLDCVASRGKPETDAVRGVQVLRVLEAAESSLNEGGLPMPVSSPAEAVPF